MQRVFSYEERIKAIELYNEKKISPASIAKQFGTYHSVVERWIRIYKEHGYDGLRLKPYNIKYSEDFKNKVIKDVLENHRTGTSAAAKYNLSHSTIVRWCVEYTKGTKMSRHRNIISAEEAAALREKYKHTKDPALKAALERNEYLEMENDVLKNLKALIEQRLENQKKR